MGFLETIVGDFESYFTDPDRKTYYLHLLSAVVLAIFFLYFVYRGKLKKGQWIRSFLFNKEHWYGKSALVDYGLIIFNVFIRTFLIVPFFMTGTMLAFEISRWMMVHIEVPIPSDASKTFVIIFYTVSLWLTADFSRFLLHYLAHKIPFLWEFHKVHHSATTMNPFTQYREHPVEMFLFNIRGMLVFGVVTGIFHYYYAYQLGMVEVLGVNIGRFIFLSFGSNLRHSHIPLSFGKFLEHIFISPLQHQIHHSKDPKDYDKNMGSQLALWDWLFGTLKVAEKGKTEYVFGLGDEDKNYNSVLKALLIPIKKSFSGRKSN